MNFRSLVLGAFLFLLGQTLVWYQINGQFISTWIKERPIVMSLLGVPISYIYIYATQYTVEAFGGSLWPQRLIGFSMGMVSFAILFGTNQVVKDYSKDKVQFKDGIDPREAYRKQGKWRT